ncbi:MAG: GDSL-type esterase/lipase family protein [Lentisphaeria bacterium]|nr:GDSL-type esterase/lipase family protein [Lentisphaeria bacterium]
MNKRLIVHRFLLLVGSSLFALFLAEGVCRIFFPAQPSIRFQQDVDELRGMKLDEAPGMIKNDHELFWRLVPNKRLPDDSWPFFGVISNEQSLREDHEIPLAKPVGETRILFLGDSCTFGYGVPHHAAFVQVAEAALQDISPGPVECINAGVPGYTLFQGYRYLGTEGLRYQPDLVVLNFGWNDNGIWDPLGDIEHYARMKKMQPPGPLRKSGLCRLMWSIVNRPAPPDPGQKKRPRLLPGEFRETLGKIHSLLEEQRIPLLVLVWPMRLNTQPDIPPEGRTALQIEMMSFGQAHPFLPSPPVSGMLDLVPLGQALVREHGPEAIYFDHGHVKPMAHQAIGEAIAEHLSPWISETPKKGTTNEHELKRVHACHCRHF